MCGNFVVEVGWCDKIVVSVVVEVWWFVCGDDVWCRWWWEGRFVVVCVCGVCCLVMMFCMLFCVWYVDCYLYWVVDWCLVFDYVDGYDFVFWVGMCVCGFFCFVIWIKGGGIFDGWCYVDVVVFGGVEELFVGFYDIDGCYDFF